MSMTKFNLTPYTPTAFSLHTSATYFGLDAPIDTFVFATRANTAPTDISAPIPSFGWATEQDVFDFGRPASDLPANSGTLESNTEGSDARGDGDGNVIRPTYGDDGKWPTPIKCEDFPAPVEQPPIKCEDFPAPVKPTFGDDAKTETPLIERPMRSEDCNSDRPIDRTEGDDARWGVDNTEGDDTRGDGDGNVIRPTMGDDAKTSPTPDTDLPSSGPCQGYVGSVRPDDTPGTVFPTPTPDKVIDKPVVETVTEVVCVMPPPEKVVTEVVCVMPKPTPEIVQPIKEIVVETGTIVCDPPAITTGTDAEAKGNVNDVTKTSPELPVETGVIVCDPSTPEVVEPTKEVVTETGTVVCDPPATETGTDFNLKAWFGDDTIVFQPKADVDTTPFIPNPFVIEMIGTDPAPSKGEIIPTDTWVEPIIGNQPMHIDKGELLAA